MLQETLAAIRSLPDMSADVGKLRTDLEKVVLGMNLELYPKTLHVF